ncbi:MAG TPA: CHAT domain-containing protein [Pyrinomonadaceae bacterium]
MLNKQVSAGGYASFSGESRNRRDWFSAAKSEDSMLFRNRRRSRNPLRQLAQFLFLSLFIVVFWQTESVRSLPETSAGKAKLTSLAPGTGLLRGISAGDKQQFEISLASGDLFQLLVDKGDLALALVLYDPAGRKLIEQVSRGYEVLKLSLPADSGGVYRLEISSLEREASRQYELRVEPIRRATTEDKKGHTAQQSAARASFLLNNWNAASFRHAIENYDGAAMTWRSLLNLRNAAIASMNAGRVCFLAGEYREALKRYQTAAELSRRVGARLEEAAALSEIGRLYSYLGNNDKAHESLLRALEFFAADGKGNQPAVRQAYAQALNNLGEVNYSKGNLVKSSADFEHALNLFREVGDRGGEARVHLFKGYIAGGLGQPEQAVTEISQALALYQAVTDRNGEGLCLTALGLSHSIKLEQERAIKLHREASAIFRAIGDRHSVGITLNALGQAYEFLSDYPMALKHYQEALQLFQDNGNLDLVPVSLFKVARVHRLAGDFSRALEYYERCLKLSRATKKRRTEANALNDVALIYASQGSREKTVRQYQKILKFYAAISDRRGQSTALNNLGDFLLRLGEKKKALDSYKRALLLSAPAGHKEVLITSLSNVARANRDLGALDDALSHITQAIETIEDLRTNVASPDFRTSYFAGVRKQYDLWIDILMQLDRRRPGQGFAAAALLASERARARSLVELVTESRADIRQGVDPQLLKKERELQSLLRSHAQYQMDLATRNGQSAEAEEVKREIDELRSQYQDVETQLRDRNPRFLALTQPPPLTLEQIQDELRDENTILLEYALGDERSYVWAVTANSLHSYELPSRATLEDAAREVYQLLTARQAVGEKVEADYPSRVETADKLYNQKALALSQMLLGPVAEQLGKNRLIVVPEGILHYIPFEALPGPQQSEDFPLLITTNEIVTLPSVSTLAVIRQEKRRQTSGDKVVAVLADPVFSSNDDRVQNGRRPPAIAFAASNPSSSQPAVRVFERGIRGGATRLLHASEEADAILATTPRGTGMIARGFDASRETAMSQIVGQHKIVHFATHGFFNTEHPELSGMILSMVNPDGSKANGFLPLHDIYHLNLSSDLVVLSACDTALGEDVKGEGLVGLTHGFLSAGSKSVVASLWKVDDRATAVLMADFYKSMLQDGLPPAAALRSAKQKIRQEKAWSAPYFWAGFVLQGEYKEPVIVDRNSWLRPGVVIWLAVLLVLFAVTLLFQKRRRRPHLVSR